MFRKQTTKENSFVGDIPETSAAFDEKDVPIYVIESNVRNKLREDIERARNEEKRLKNLQKSVRRKEILKVRLYSFISLTLRFLNFILFLCYDWNYVTYFLLYSRNCCAD